MNNPEQEQKPAPQRVYGWKGISAVLRCSENTARKYWKKHGLPVTKTGGRYEADKAELLEWLEEWEMNPEDGRLRARSSSPAAPVRKNNEIEISPSPNRRFLTAGAVAAVLTVLASGTFLVLRSDPGTMIQVQIKGESLSVLNESGKKMWTVDFPGTDFGEFTRDRHFFIKDVDQDGRKELVFIQRPREREEESSRLICIDANGRELWDFEFGEELQVGKRRFSRTYEGIRVDWTETDGRAYVLAIGYHRPWYPSQTVLLEPSTGKVVGQYWHPGQLTDFALVDIDSDPEKEILLGGLNNPGPGLGRPILAALDFPFPSLGVEESFFGPQPGREITYLVFPEIDVHHARGLSPAVHGIHARPDNRILVDVGVEPNTLLLYYFDTNLELIEVLPADGFVREHQHLARQETLDHVFDRPRELAQWSEILQFSTAPNANRLPEAGPRE